MKLVEGGVRLGEDEEFEGGFYFESALGDF